MDTFERALDQSTGGALSESRRQERRQQTQRQRPRQRAQPEVRTVGVGQGQDLSISTSAAEPVLDLEKSDLMFWMTVVQTLVLIAIWRELNNSGG